MNSDKLVFTIYYNDGEKNHKEVFNPGDNMNILWSYLSDKNVKSVSVNYVKKGEKSPNFQRKQTVVKKDDSKLTISFSIRTDYVSLVVRNRAKIKTTIAKRINSRFSCNVKILDISYAYFDANDTNTSILVTIQGINKNDISKIVVNGITSLSEFISNIVMQYLT